MSVAERERHIVDGAIAFFAEHGLDAQMRELAGAIGVTHTLVYHYFPTKRALVDRVYQDVFAGRWKPEWEALLDDRGIEVEEKLVRFYVEYARTVLTRDFVRIIVFSGLTTAAFPNRFFELLGERLFPRLIRETRRASRQPRPQQARRARIRSADGAARRHLLRRRALVRLRPADPRKAAGRWTTRPPSATASAATWRKPHAGTRKRKLEGGIDMTLSLNHFSIRTLDLEATRTFYENGAGPHRRAAAPFPSRATGCTAATTATSPMRWCT
jgi:AcrR family transcriptional regulator